MVKKIELKIVWLVLLIGFLGSCGDSATVSPSSVVNFVTPTPAPVRPTPTFTAVVVPTVPTSTVTVSAQDKLLKAFQGWQGQNFSYIFEQTGELKSGNSVTRIQVKGEGEVVQANIRQSLQLIQSGQSQKIEQVYLDKQFYQKFENLKLWRKPAVFPKFASVLPVSTFQQASAVRILGQERINNQLVDKYSFSVPGRNFFNSPAGIGLDNMGLLSAAEVWTVFARGTAQDVLVTVWVDDKTNIVQYSSMVGLSERNSSLTINSTYVVTKINGANAVLNVPTDLPKS
jgi:hypothetical protein